MPVQTRRPYLPEHRTLIIVTLVVALIGMITPFGIASEKVDDTMAPLEWVLAAIGLAAVAGLVIELATRLRAAWPFMLAGFAWTVITVYVAIGPDASFLWHLGHALITGAFAVLALTVWRLEARRKTS